MKYDRFDSQEYKEYLLSKRQDIQKMETVISVVRSKLKVYEIDLLLKSYIVLIYSFWEDSYHRTLFFLLRLYNDKQIDSLPFTIKNKTLLTNIKSKSIENITDYRRIETLYKQIQDAKKKSFCDPSFTGSEDFEKKILSEFFKSNPNVDTYNKALGFFEIKPLERLFEEFEEEESVKFIKSINFIIKQRNNIAHKNECLEISISKDIKMTFENSIECIEYFSVNILKTQKQLPEKILSDILFSIERVIHKIIKNAEQKLKTKI